MLLLQLLVFVSLGRYKIISQSPKYGRENSLPAVKVRWFDIEYN